MVYEIAEGKVIREVRKRISYKRLEWLHLLMQLQYEVGGQIRFDKSGKFQGFTLFTPGAHSNEIILPDAFPVEFHTHPLPSMVAFPSVTDLMAQAKRSINANKCKGAKGRYKQYRGAVAIVFNRVGAVIYAYKRCKLPSRKEQKELLEKIISLSAKLGSQDSMANLKQQAKVAREYGFRICLQSWPKIIRSGMLLTFQTRRFHVPSSHRSRT